MSSGTVADITLGSTRRSILAQVLRGAAIVFATLCLLLVVAQAAKMFPKFLHRDESKASGRNLRPKSPQLGKGDKSDSPNPDKSGPVAGGESTAGESTAEAQSAASDQDRSITGFKVVALDGMGVLYSEGNNISNLLLPFAREKGSRSSKEEISKQAKKLSLGRITTSEFWKAIGVNGEPNTLDTEYVATHQLTPGVVKYLRQLRENGVKVACITNDCVSWAMKLRSNFSLEGLVDPWIVSGSVGVRKPDPPIFDVLRRLTNTPPEEILIVDDNLSTLNAARDLGFATALFGKEQVVSEPSEGETGDDLSGPAAEKTVAELLTDDEETPHRLLNSFASPPAPVSEQASQPAPEG